MSIRRGEVYFVNLNPVQGREQAGKRPVLVLLETSYPDFSASRAYYAPSTVPLSF